MAGTPGPAGAVDVEVRGGCDGRGVLGVRLGLWVWMATTLLLPSLLLLSPHPTNTTHTQNTQNDNYSTTTTAAAVARAGAFQSLAVTELQAQLRALREELAALAPLKQEVDALRGQLRELQQKQ